MNTAEFIFKTILLCSVGNMILLTMYNDVTELDSMPEVNTGL